MPASIAMLSGRHEPGMFPAIAESRPRAAIVPKASIAWSAPCPRLGCRTASHMTSSTATDERWKSRNGCRSELLMGIRAGHRS